MEIIRKPIEFEMDEHIRGLKSPTISSSELEEELYKLRWKVGIVPTSDPLTAEIVTREIIYENLKNGRWNIMGKNFDDLDLEVREYIERNYRDYRKTLEEMPANSYIPIK